MENFFKKTFATPLRPQAPPPPQTSKPPGTSVFGDMDQSSGGIKYKYGPSQYVPPPVPKPIVPKPNPLEQPDFDPATLLGAKSHDAATAAASSGPTSVAELLATQSPQTPALVTTTNDGTAPTTTTVPMVTSFIPPEPAAVVAQRLREQLKAHSASTMPADSTSHPNPSQNGYQSSPPQLANQHQFTRRQLLDMATICFFETADQATSHCTLCSLDKPLDHWHYLLFNRSVVRVQAMPSLISEPTKICDHCAKMPRGPGTAEFKLCSRCRTVYYCSEECHLDGWAGHQVDCARASGQMMAKLLPVQDLGELEENNNNGGFQGRYQNTGGYQGQQRNFFNRLRNNEQARAEAGQTDSGAPFSNQNFQKPPWIRRPQKPDPKYQLAPVPLVAMQNNELANVTDGPFKKGPKIEEILTEPEGLPPVTKPTEPILVTTPPAPIVTSAASPITPVPVSTPMVPISTPPPVTVSQPISQPKATRPVSPPVAISSAPFGRQSNLVPPILPAIPEMPLDELDNKYAPLVADFEDQEEEPARQYTPVEVPTAETTSFAGCKSDLKRLTLKEEKAYKLMPLYIEDVSDRKRVIFYVCQREYLAKILIYAKETQAKSPLMDVNKLVVNGVYLVKFDDEWFRGQILRTTEQHFYVDYFDFGNHKYVSKKDAEYSFRVLDPALSPVTVLPAAVRVQLKNVPSFQQYNYLQRVIKECIKNFQEINFYVMSFCKESDSYQVQLDEPQ